MKNTAALLILAFLAFVSQPVHGQDSTYYLLMTSTKWNKDLEDFSSKEWRSIEKEYLEKVTKKNNYIVTSGIMTHYFTADNTELKFFYVYRSWEDMEKANMENLKLVIEAWPDEKDRNQFFKKRSDYYVRGHSDEIYLSMPGSKFTPRGDLKSAVMYMRVNKLAHPEDGDVQEFASLMKEYNEFVTQKNEYILEYYPNRHLYGSDGRDQVDFFVVKTLADIDKSFDRNNELINAHWPEAEKRNVFFKKLGKYFTGEHGDYIYMLQYDLSK